MRKLLTSGLMMLLAAPLAQAEASAQAPKCPSAAALTRGFSGAMAHVRYLSDDALGGREVGSVGERCAADYVTAQFRALGLKPVTGTAYLQAFPVRSGTSIGKGSRLEVGGAAIPLGRDWTPYGFSASVRVAAPALYAHHGWGGASQHAGGGNHGAGHAHDASHTAPEDASGRVVMIHADLGMDPHLQATRAIARGAAAVVLLYDSLPELPAAERELRPALSVPVLAARGAAAERLRAAAQKGESVTISTELSPRTVQGHNVAALLPGRDPALKDEVVVIGAHLDHLGHGGPGSLAPESREIHNGADDNASGVAALLELARRLRADPPARPVLFLAFSGEERGLLGSAFYATQPLVPLERTVAMLNLDMVGRLKDDALAVLGVGTAREWRGVLEQANGSLAQPMRLALGEDGFGPSDHSSFYARGVPVLHFFTNAHEDYHRPSDDWQKINREGLDRVIGLVERVARSAGGGARVTAVAGAGNPHAGGSLESSESARSGSMAYLGTIPDYSPTEGGVGVTGVRTGSPAEAAGIRGGDKIVAIGGRAIGDIYAYTYALRDYKPGDVVKIEVEREGKRVTLTATLGERR